MKKVGTALNQHATTARLVVYRQQEQVRAHFALKENIPTRTTMHASFARGATSLITKAGTFSIHPMVIVTSAITTGAARNFRLAIALPVPNVIQVDTWI